MRRWGMTLQGFRPLPAAPTGVRVQLPDGMSYACELVYRGVDADGFHVWEATAAVPLMVPGTQILADKVPARTRIGFRCVP